ncbi:MAG: DUF2190 family protein [Chitinophagaceae bacterium]|nr:DUF2190 family protein [Chitinophagaceae bacterium]
MKNFIQKGDFIDVVAGGAITGGSVQKVGDLIGIATKGAATGESFPVALTGVFLVPKATSLAINQGDTLYWDVADGNFNKTAADNFKGGHAAAGALSADTTVLIRLAQ